MRISSTDSVPQGDAKYVSSCPPLLLEGKTRGHINMLTKTLHEGNVSVRQPMQNEEAILADIPGAGTVTYIKVITGDPLCDAYRLRVYVDGERNPAIDAEFGCLFGGQSFSVSAATQNIPYSTEHVGMVNTSGSVRTGTWWFKYPFSFASGCRITVYNPAASTQNSIYTQVNYVTGVADSYRLRSTSLTPFFSSGQGVSKTSDLTIGSVASGSGLVVHHSFIGWDSGATGSGTWQERDFTWYPQNSASTPLYLSTGFEDWFDGAYYVYPNWPWSYVTPNGLTAGRVAVKDILAQHGGLAYSNGWKAVLPQEGNHTTSGTQLDSTHTSCILYYELSGSGATYTKDTTPLNVSALPSGLVAAWDFALDHWTSVFTDSGTPYFLRASVGNAVGAVLDKSGNGYHLGQSSATNRGSMVATAYTGGQAFTTTKLANPNGQFLQTPVAESIPGLTDFDIFFVGSLVWGTDSRGILSNNNSLGNSHQHNLHIDGLGYMYAYDMAANNGSTVPYTSTGVAQGAAAVFEFTRTGTTYSWYVNGVQVGADVVAASTQPMILDTIERWSGTPVDPTIRLGTLIFGRKLTPAERVATVASLRAQYGV